MRTLGLPRQGVKGGKRGNASQRAGENAGEKTNRFRQRLRATVRFCDKECGAAQFVRDIGRYKRFGHVVQTGYGNAIGARAQGRECAFHRRMAQHTFQSFSDCGENHSWGVKNPRERLVLRRESFVEFPWWSSRVRPEPK